MRLNALASAVFYTSVYKERGRETVLASAFKRTRECGFLCRGGKTVLASTVNRTHERGFLYTLAYKKGGNRAS